MTSKDVGEKLSERTVAEIVSAFAGRADVSIGDIIELIQQLGARTSRRPSSDTAISNLASKQKKSFQAVVSKADAVTPDKVFCLCCGRGFAMLKRHLGAEHNLSELEYREMFALSEDFPLVAPSYSKLKAAHAKNVGLGKHARG
jgi:predicted transcriptional regulator